jgi:hypothetical protein
MTTLFKKPNSKGNHEPSLSKAFLTIVGGDYFVFAERIPKMTAAVHGVTNPAVILQQPQELYDTPANPVFVVQACTLRNAAATDAKVRHNRKRPANVGGGVVFSGNSQVAVCNTMTVKLAFTWKSLDLYLILIS